MDLTNERHERSDEAFRVQPLPTDKRLALNEAECALQCKAQSLSAALPNCALSLAQNGGAVIDSSVEGAVITFTHTVGPSQLAGTLVLPSSSGELRDSVEAQKLEREKARTQLSESASNRNQLLCLSEQMVKRMGKLQNH